MKKIMLVEDDLDLQKLIYDYLQNYGYNSILFCDPREALDEFRENSDSYSVLILDLGLPHMDGFDLLKQMKEIKNLPVIISTARGDIGNKIYGFELGADDYLSKPYEPRELILRIEAILRRSFNEEELYKLDDIISINNTTEQVYFDGDEIEFTKVEKEIFFLLLNNQNSIISREQIVKESSLKEDTKNRTIDTHISNIRFKIDDDPKEPKYIKSVWGIGYKFINDN
jgi:DNA-binding response OmpR family regulator